jgi:predicted enzyme related to lactoylglutathione lyase
MTPDRYPPGVPCWIEAPPASLAFAAELLGWEVRDGVATLDGRAVAGTGQRPGWTTYVRGEAGSITDPQGAFLGVTPDASAELVNAPGSWNWSTLLTPDPDAAARFYGERLGWVVDAAGMVMQPGYADVLERFDPGIRDRHAEFGAPEGFSDAVAWIAQGDEARWEVTFAVADADVTAARAAALGGDVMVAPHDIHPTRLAVLRDPEGAMLTVSAFSA